MRHLIPPIMFMLSAGLFFNGREKRNIVAVGVAGVLAVVATFFTVEQLVDRLGSYAQGKTTAPWELAAAIITLVGSVAAAIIGCVMALWIAPRELGSSLSPESPPRLERQRDSSTWDAERQVPFSVRPDAPREEATAPELADDARKPQPIEPLRSRRGYQGTSGPSPFPSKSELEWMRGQTFSPEEYQRLLDGYERPRGMGRWSKWSPDDLLKQRDADNRRLTAFSVIVILFIILGLFVVVAIDPSHPVWGK
jgi:hypothetical protein